MQVQSITGTGKYSKTPESTFYEICKKFWGQKNSTKDRDNPPPLHKFFDTRYFQKHQKRPPHDFFRYRETKCFDIFFVITTSVVYQYFRSRQMVGADFELFSACLKIKLSIRELPIKLYARMFAGPSGIRKY